MHSWSHELNLSCSLSQRCQWKCLPTIWHRAILYLRLTSANPSWDFQTCDISQTVPESWELLCRESWGSGKVSPHLATCQRASSLPTAAGRCCCFSWPLQHQLSNWPVQCLWTTFSYLLIISDQHKRSWKLVWNVPALQIAESLKRKLRLDSCFETMLVSREV